MNHANYFDRAYLKRSARENLKGKYGAALVAVLLALIVTQLLSGFATFLTNSLTSFTPFRMKFGVYNVDVDSIGRVTAFLRDLFQPLLSNRPLLIVVLFLIITVPFLYSLFVGNVLKIGLKRWFLRASHPHYATPPMELLFSPFKRGQYIAAFKAAFWKSMWLFVWSVPVILFNFFLFTPIVLLFIAFVKTGSNSITPELVDRVLEAYGLPGLFYSPAFFAVVGTVLLIFLIVLRFKRYQYKMTDYILADNPHIGTRRALTLSKQMSKGSLWRFLVLDLSFAGWFIVAAMCICLPGISIFLVFPYYEATWVEAYKNRRDYLVECQELTMEELGYVRMFSGS